MHLSVPATGGLRGIASELATRIAEHLGAGASDARSIGTMVEGLATRLANGSGDRAEAIAFDFRHVGGELVVEARCSGKASEIRHQITA